MRQSVALFCTCGLAVLLGIGLATQLAAYPAAPAAVAGGWPQFRFDAARSGYTPADLSAELGLRWEYRSSQPPQPAWLGQDTRLPFDYAFQPVIANGLLFFGSSADCKIYALDAATGEARWAAYTDSPVRFAPAVWRDRLFVGSDDGNLYCFEAATGRRLWVRGIAPGPDMLLGNGRLISRWPVRGGPAISGDVLYVAAGIWPSEGIYLKALDAETGEPRWVNDTAGYIEMNQPHGGARAKSGVSAQGYLTVAPDTLLVPTGRATPAAFDLADGDFRYFHLQEYSRRGAGPFVTAVGEWHFSELDGFFTDDGEAFARGIPSAAMAILPDYIVFAEKSEIKAISRSELLVEKEGADRRGEPIKTLALNEPAWTIQCPGPVGPSLIGAGSKIIAGLTGDPKRSTPHQVIVIDLDSRTVVFTAEVDGPALGLGAADGRLYVSTNQGTIYCFAQGTGAPATVGPAAEAPPAADTSGLGSLVDEIIAKTGITKGYCVDLGCGDGGLAYELAKRTDLRIYAVASDAENVAHARRRLSAAGLYGTRVTVLERDLADSGLPNYLGNLVVSAQSAQTGGSQAPREELERLRRPYGGVLCLGRSGDLSVSVRGPLEGAGEWTHQYADPGNTGASTDAVVKAPLGMLWFADNTFEMPSRHGRGPSPLFWNGIVFVEGIDGVRALDAYNGTRLWEYPLPGILRPYDQEHLNGVAITGSNMCIAGGSLFVRLENRCLRLDAATGKKTAEFTAPPRPDGTTGRWGYIACTGGTLFGSLYNEEHQVTFAFGKSDMSQLFSESVLLFAIDAKTGDLKWTYKPDASIRNNSIAVGSGRVFLIDRPIAVRDRAKDDQTEQPLGKLVGLDATTGSVLWAIADDSYGTMLEVSEEHNVLLMAYQSTRFKLNSEAGGRLTAFNAIDGARLWDVREAYVTRPMIIGRTIYAQPGAWDLLTGARKDFNLTRSYGCGILAGSTNLLAYRSATLGYWDLTADRGTENYGGIRPGCWINALPVGGLLLLPEASNRCTCSYLIKATIALQPYGVRAPIVTPGSAASKEPIPVRIAADRPDDQIRYTLDGTAPTLDSSRYSGPFEVTESATLIARAFRDGIPGPTTAASFIVDPDIIPIDGDAWQVHDTPGGGPPESNWVVADGIANEISNHCKGSASDPNPEMERLGTYRAYAPGAAFTDGELTFDIACADNDGLGVAFRFQDPGHYYLWSMDSQRGFRILARKNGDEYQVLDRNTKGYQPNRWYEVRVVLKGSKLAVYVDGELDFGVNDGSFAEGTFALYSWGNTGAKFRNVRWRAAE